MVKKSNKAVVLLSGGLDSTVVLSICKKLNYEIYAITFNYNQRHKTELYFAKWQARFFKCKSHRIFNLDFFGGSSLTDNMNVPKNERVEDIKGGIPNTYVPSRNIIFLSFASGYAESKEIENIFLGVNAVDYSGYPDCRKEFIKGFEKLINFSTKKGLDGNKFKIKTPLIDLKKKDIIDIGFNNGVNFAFTSSCYDPKNNKACGLCDACLLREKGFHEAGKIDPQRERNYVL